MSKRTDTAASTKQPGILATAITAVGAVVLSPAYLYLTVGHLPIVQALLG